MKKVLILIITILPTLSAFAQKEQVDFRKLSSWELIKAKAKEENKYIFVDCYATWCVPCKWMDENIYTQKAVAEVYNTKFICIKMQMDETAKDDIDTKTLRPVAKMLERSYHIDAYPCYLFFDSNGMAVHKATGSMDAGQFIGLANDAENPAKQYYQLLKNFKPNTLDTAEEKALINTYASVDTAFSNRLAADYLQRVPENELIRSDNLQLLGAYRSTRDVMTIINHYLDKHDTKPNANLLIKLNSLARVKEIASRYINNLPQDSLFTPANIRLLAVFTTAIDQRGFKVFYDHGDHVDAVMKQKGYAHANARSMISRFVVSPVLTIDKQNNVTPDFEMLAGMLTKQYDPTIANSLVMAAKLDWYKYMIRSKKDTTFLPKLIDEQIKQIVSEWNIDDDRFYVNNFCYVLIFPHSTTKEQLETGIAWMKQIVKKHADDRSYSDTYACLLYKAGKVNEALALETEAVDFFLHSKYPKEAEPFQNTLDRMKRGEKIWLESAYQTKI